MLFVTKVDLFIHSIIFSLCLLFDSKLSAIVYLIFAIIQLFVLFLSVSEWLGLVKDVEIKYINFAGSIITLFLTPIIYGASLSMVDSIEEKLCKLNALQQAGPDLPDGSFSSPLCSLCTTENLDGVIASTKENLDFWAASVNTLGLDSISLSWVFFGLSLLCPFGWMLWQNYRANN